MATCPPLLVPAPAPDTYTGGLFSAAAFPSVDGDPHWQCGVEWEINNCAKPGVWAETCPPDVPDNKPRTYVPEWATATPFNVVLGVDCSLPGNTLADFRRRLVQNMTNCAQTVAERVYMTGEQGNTSRLTGPVAADPDNPLPGEVVVLSPLNNPLTMVGGVAALESYIGANYCGVGVIHAPAGMSAFASAQHLIYGNPGGKLTTVLGTRWAFGRGYEANVGPDGTEADPGTAWLYATGRVAVWQSPIFIPNDDDLQASFNRTTNTVEMVAEQTFIIGHECITAAVQVVAGCNC